MIRILHSILLFSSIIFINLFLVFLQLCPISTQSFCLFSFIIYFSFLFCIEVGNISQLLSAANLINMLFIYFFFQIINKVVKENLDEHQTPYQIAPLSQMLCH